LKEKRPMPIENLMSLDEIKEGLKGKRLHSVAKEIGISYPTLKKLHDGVAANFTLDTVTRVSNYLQGVDEIDEFDKDLGI